MSSLRSDQILNAIKIEIRVGCVTIDKNVAKMTDVKNVNNCSELLTVPKFSFKMESTFVTINKVPTKVITLGSGIEDKPSKLILVIPGKNR